ncbi:MAG TPA: MFS transporter [Pyrinomonadaceae bacterium]|jgi:MFS family permease|nr:MFS transporter [Pyrinomonadaceae bacterium]
MNYPRPELQSRARLRQPRPVSKTPNRQPLGTPGLTPPENTSRTPAARRPSSFVALRHRDFRLFWSGQFVSIIGSQMQLVTVNWHVYALTHSAAALGLVGLVRVLPIIVCSLVGGVVADAFDRKRLILATQTVMLLSAAALALFTASGLASVWPIYLLTAVSSAATAFDNPARQALIPSLVPERDFPNAVSVGFVAFQVAMVAGPMLGGVALARFGFAAVYAFNAASFVAIIAAILMIRASGKAKADESSRVSLEALKEGLRFVWRTPIMVQTTALDFVATFFASATALLPIFARDILRVGEHGYGVLAAAAAFGAVLTGLLLARRPAAWGRPGFVMLLAVGVYGAATVVFGLSRNYFLSLLMLAVTGAADTVSTVIRQTIRQLITPDRLRGRMTSVNMIFFMGGPQLGELEAGLLAAAAGAQASVVIGGVGCVLAVLFTASKARELLRYRFKRGEEVAT